MRATTRCAIDLAIGVDHAPGEAADQPQRRFGAFQIAAEPEQIVGGAARQIAHEPADADGFVCRQQSDRFDRRVRR